MANNRVTIIFYILGLVGILDTIFVLILNGGRNLGTLLPGVLGAAMLFWGLKRKYLKQHFLRDRVLWLRRLVRLKSIVFDR